MPLLGGPDDGAEHSDPWRWPFKRVGAMGISDHWVRSPVLNINNACQTCHTWPEEELRARVHEIQDRTYELRNIAIDALQLSGAIAERAAAEPADPNLSRARDYQRRAQFLTDFIEAENSMGFHAPQEGARVLGNAINYARIGLAAVDGRALADPEASSRPATEQTVSPAPAATRDGS